MKEGNVGGALLDAAGVVADTVAAVVPGAPGGAGSGIRALRAGDVAVDAARATSKARTGPLRLSGKLSRDNLRTGQLFEASIETRKGPVDLLGEIVVDGDTLILQDLAVYGRGTQPLTGLQRELLAARTQLSDIARGLGFTKLRIMAQRSAGSSSAKPGKVVDATIDLTQK